MERINILVDKGIRNVGSIVIHINWRCCQVMLLLDMHTHTHTHTKVLRTTDDSWDRQNILGNPYGTVLSNDYETRNFISCWLNIGIMSNDEDSCKPSLSRTQQWACYAPAVRFSAVVKCMDRINVNIAFHFNS